MNLSALQDVIKKKIITFPLLLVGEEAGIKEIYIAQIAKAYGKPFKRFDSVLDAVRAFKGMALIKKEEFIAVVSEDKKFQTQEELWAKLPQDFDLILCYEKLDARLRFTKNFEYCTYDFDRLSAAQLARYVMRDTKLSQAQAETLALNAGLDYLRVQSEINKLQHYANSDNDVVFFDGLKDGIFSIQWENRFEKFISQVLRGDTTSAIKEWERLKSLGESELKVFAWLFGDFKNLLLMQTGERLNPYITLRLKDLKKYTAETLRDILWLLNDISIKVKRGKMAMDVAVDYLLVSLG